MLSHVISHALNMVLWMLAGIGLLFVIIAATALVLAFQAAGDSPAHDGRLVVEGRVPATFKEPGSEAQDSSRSEVAK